MDRRRMLKLTSIALASAAALPTALSRGVAVATLYDMLITGEATAADLVHCLVGVLAQVRARALHGGPDRIGHDASSRILRNPSSSSTGTPSDSAFASLLPALSPATR